MEAAHLIERLRGVYPAIPTFLDRSGAVDRAAHERHTEALIQAGVNGVVALGTSGEGPVLSLSQRAGAIAAVRHGAGGRIPVVAGCGAVSLDTARDMVSHAADCGADAVLLLPPLYFTYPEPSLLEFYTEVADRSSIPVLIYHFPTMSKNPLSLSAVRALSMHPRIIGIKDSQRDFVFHTGLLAECRSETFRVFQGSAPLLHASFTMGGDGGISPVSALVPELELSMYAAVRDGRHEQAQFLSSRIAAIARLFAHRGYPLPANLKGLSHLLGYGSPYSHAPCPSPNDQHLAELRAELARLEIALP